MAFNPFGVLKALLIKQEGTLTPTSLQITPGGTAGTQTNIVGAQTSTRTLTLPDATDTLTANAATQTLSNKTLGSTNTTTGVQMASFTPDGTHTLTAPAATDTLTANGVAQTLTNKTFDSTSTATGIKIASFTPDGTHTLTAPATTDTLTANSATQTLANKTLDNTTIEAIKDSNLSIQNSSDTSKIAKFDASAITASTTRTYTLPDATTTLVGIATTQTLSNKTLDNTTVEAIKDSNLSIENASDVSKIAKFDASSISASTTRTYTLPDATTTLVGTGTTQTLTNKTLGFLQTTVSSDATTTGSNATIVAFTSGVVRLTNASLASLSGIPAGSSGQQLVIENQTGASITINNDDAGASAANRIYTGTNNNVTMANNATLILTYDATATHWMLTAGSGASTSETNYITNSNAESDTSGWAAYANTAGTSPVTGTGGSPSVTWTRSTSSPLNGTASFVFTKGGSNLQGNGVSYAFTIDSADQAKVLQIQMNYIVASGTFVAGSPGVDSDVTCWIYDVTNGLVIQPSTYKFFSNSTTTSGSFISNFQTASNSTSYRLILHVGTTSASAYTLKFDNFVVAPSNYSYGTVITDWQNFPNTSMGASGSTTTLLTVSTGTAPTYGVMTNQIARWRRVGGDMEIDVILDKTSGGTTQSSANIILMNLPPGYAIDTTKTGTNGSADSKQSGVGVFHYSSVNGATRYAANGIAHVWNSTQLYFDYGIVNSAGSANCTAWTAADDFFTSAQNPTCVHIHATLPISGWSVQQQTSDVNDQRIVVADYAVTSNTTATSLQPINWDTKIVDTHAAMASGVFTAPVSGVYWVACTFSPTSSTTQIMWLYKNAAAYRVLTSMPDSAGTNAGWGASCAVSLIAGDTIDIRSKNTVTLTINSGTGTVTQCNFVSIAKIGNPAQISATENVSARYFSSSSTVSGSLGTITYATKDFDSHGQYSSGVYTIPTSGKYQVNAAIAVSGTYALNGTLDMQIQKNGVAVSEDNAIAGGAQTSMSCNCSDIISCVAGDQIRIQASSSATSPTIVVSNNKNLFSINKLGL